MASCLLQQQANSLFIAHAVMFAAVHMMTQFFNRNAHIFTVRLHVMQRMVLLSQFCLYPSVKYMYCDKTK